MTTKDLKKRSMGDLLALQRRVAAAIKAKRKQVQQARDRLVAMATKLGVSTRELTSLLRRRGPDKAPRKAKAKHVNPKAPEQTWNGKGRPPAWFKAMKGNGAGSHATH